MMTLFNRAISGGRRSIFGFGVVASAMGFAGFAHAQVQFEAPNSSLPESSIGGGTRGNVEANDSEGGQSAACGMEFEMSEELALNSPTPEDAIVEMSFLNPEAIASGLAQNGAIDDPAVPIIEGTQSDEMADGEVQLLETCKQDDVNDDSM